MLASLFAGWVFGLPGVLAGCDRDPQVPGQLVVTLQTDMALPQQIDNLLVQVTRAGGEVLHMQYYPLGLTSEYRVPGTVSLVAGESIEPITITVAGSKNEVWRTYREIVTTVPRDRVAELRMPIQWLCNEAAQPMISSLPDGRGGVVNRVIQNCDEGFTCKAGTCRPKVTDSETLPDYAPEAVFGGAREPANGACFDVVSCMAAAITVKPDEDCTIARPDGDTFNVGLRVAGGGICNDDGPVTTCYVPLDGEDDEGWTYTADGERIQLPQAVCTRLAERKVLAVQVSTACPTKEVRLPPCGAWSSVPDDQPVRPPSDSPAASWASPEVLTTLSLEGAGLCCPLMSEGQTLYTCSCAPEPTSSNANSQSADANAGQDAGQGSAEDPASGPVASVHVIDTASGVSTTLELSMRPSLAAAVQNQTLYWAGAHDLFQLPLQPGAIAASFPGRGGLYLNGVLLTDANGYYVLTSGVEDAQNNSAQVVQLLRFSVAGAVTSMDPLGNRAVKQFAQDDTAFYAAMNFDEIVEPGQPFVRRSSVVRIDKQSGASTKLLNEERLTISDLLYNGFLGVVSDGTDVFTLFESEPADGIEHFQIDRITQAGGAAPRAFSAIFDLPASIEPRHTAVRLLGAVDGAVLFSRDEYSDDAGRLRSSSLLVIPAGQTAARFVADFVADAPFLGLAASDDRIFWLNQSGRIFALDREALAP